MRSLRAPPQVPWGEVRLDTEKRKSAPPRWPLRRHLSAISNPILSPRSYSCGRRRPENLKPFSKWLPPLRTSSSLNRLLRICFPVATQPVSHCWRDEFGLAGQTLLPFSASPACGIIEATKFSKLRPSGDALQLAARPGGSKRSIILVRTGSAAQTDQQILMVFIFEKFVGALK